MIFGEQPVDIEPALADLHRANRDRDLESVGRGGRYGGAAERVAGECAKATVEDCHQLVGVGIEQGGALLEFHAGIVE